MMLFSSNVSGYCSSVNSVTGNVVITSYTTGSTFWPNLANVSLSNSYYLIARAYFQKMSPTTNIPGWMEEQKIYYLRKFANNVVKIYMTRIDAINAVNHVTFTTSTNGYLFAVYFPDIYYRSLNTWKPAEPQISDIPCCPPVPSVYTECPDTATVTYRNNEIEIKRNGPNNLSLYYGSVTDKIKYWQGGNISAHQIINLQHPNYPNSFGNWFAIISINFNYSTEDTIFIAKVLSR